jgi:hypothetical protein
MPKITNFVFCEQVEREGNQPLPINPIHMIPLDSDPSDFSIVVSLVGFEPFVDHSGYISIIDPNGNSILTTDKFTLPREGTEEDFKDRNVISGASLSIDFGVLFESQGLYIVELYFDEEKLAEFCIPVMQKGSEQ